MPHLRVYYMKSPQPENLEEVMSKTATNNEALSSLLVYLAKKIEPDTTSIAPEGLRNMVSSWANKKGIELDGQKVIMFEGSYPEVGQLRQSVIDFVSLGCCELIHIEPYLAC